MSFFSLFLNEKNLNITQIFLFYFVFLVFYLLSAYDNTKCTMFLPSRVYEMPLFVCNMPLLVDDMPLLLVNGMPLLVNETPLLVNETPLLVTETPLLVKEMLLYEMPFLLLIIIVIMNSASIYVKTPKNVMFRCLCKHELCSCAIYKGGYKLCLATYADIKDYLLEEYCTNRDLEFSEFKFVGHMHKSDAKKYGDTHYIHVLLPLHAHVKIVHLTECKKIANEHGVLAHPRTTIASMRKLFSEHECDKCSTYITVF
jgi:hypothetical protein